MPRDMFGDVVDPSIHVGGGKKWYTVPLSIVVHTLVITTLIIIPLMVMGELPMPVVEAINYVAVDIKLPTPPPPPSAAKPPTPPRGPVSDPRIPPIEPRDGIGPEPPDVTPPGPPGPPGEVPGNPGVPPGIFNRYEAPPPPPAPPAMPQEPVRLPPNVKAPSKVVHVDPKYPTIAQQAKVQGIVILEATIGINGEVQDVKVLRSIPLLDAAAVEAVKQWRFTPTTIDGRPIAVILTVTVNFALR